MAETKKTAKTTAKTAAKTARNGGSAAKSAPTKGQAGKTARTSGTKTARTSGTKTAPTKGQAGKARNGGSASRTARNGGSAAKTSAKTAKPVVKPAAKTAPKKVVKPEKTPKVKWGNALYEGTKSYNIIGARKAFFIVSLILTVLSVGSIFVFGLNLGIDFKGGSEFTISNTSVSEQQPAIDAVHTIDQSDEPLVSNVGANSLRVQTAKITNNDDVIKLRDALAKAYSVESDNVSNTSIGPTWGASVGLKALEGLLVFLIACAAFMTIYFRSWQMALSGILALIHDLAVTIGIYALVGFEITPASVIGFLTILGYSMYDTVVVFDKVRENTRNFEDQTRTKYSELANLAVNQTLVRSINTSVVALLPIGSILFFGAFVMKAGTLRDIALALFVGMAIGAYSSIFLATPLEVSLRSFTKRLQDHNLQVDLQRELFKSQAKSEGVDLNENEIKQAKLMPGSRVDNKTARMAAAAARREAAKARN